MKGANLMSNVYILVEERETSVACKIHGVWDNREKACAEMVRVIKQNPLFNEKSNVDVEEGIAESDPDYCDEEYCNYSIDEYLVL